MQLILSTWMEVQAYLLETDGILIPTTLRKRFLFWLQVPENKLAIKYMSSMLWHLHKVAKQVQTCLYAYWYLFEAIFTLTLLYVIF